VAADKLAERAQQLARSFVGASPLAAGLVKQNLGLSLASDLKTMLSMEADHQALCFCTPAHEQAVARFLAKEPPSFAWPAP
jgi:2-(1,2-epoxy-1,2-dihydrophenyl)acetyl-CoA isomerase